MINTAHPALPSPNPHRIWLVGAGGAGCNIIERVKTQALRVAANYEWPRADTPGITRLTMPAPMQESPFRTSASVLALANQWRPAFTEACQGITSWPEQLHLISGWGGTGLALVRLFFESAPVTTAVVLWQLAPFCFEDHQRAMSILEKIIDIRPDVQLKTLPNDPRKGREKISLLDLLTQLNKHHAATIGSALKIL
ncbi:MAG: hypothetical protein II007_14590 [Gammaproteobacteria bacterium]|nr:hypothetical protein [Gammaproteobacteria bacterium]